MKWIKHGLIFNPPDHKLINGQATEFAQSPQVIILNDRVRIYFSTRVRDNNGQKFYSHVAFADFDLSLQKITGISTKQVIPLGNRGCFDEHGIFPFSPYQDDNKLIAYTCGWSRRSSVSVETATGYAESFDNGETFKKLGSGQIFGASLHQPFLVGDSFVRKYNGVYHMWYMFGQKWVHETEISEPDRVYKIGHAISDDGINWNREDHAIIDDVLHENECQALPTVIHHNGLYHMVFCYRDVFGFRTDKAKSYRLGYAYSTDLVTWHRNDKILNLPTGGNSEWDSDMMCYPHLFALNGSVYLLYNGNHFGRYGFGMAKLEFMPLIKQNTSSANDIFNHLLVCDKDFVTQLQSRIDINVYSQKLHDKAIRFEAWDQNKLIGLVAMYQNDDFCFISNVSVDSKYEHQGIASQLLMIATQNANNSPIKLEVHSNNKTAIHIYTKMGFIISHLNDDYITMELLPIKADKI
jgi:ribosomal protein S18 acetylase RimI-like enzyme